MTRNYRADFFLHCLLVRIWNYLRFFSHLIKEVLIVQEDGVV